MNNKFKNSINILLIILYFYYQLRQILWNDIFDNIPESQQLKEWMCRLRNIVKALQPRNCDFRTHAADNTDVKCLLLRKFFIYNFSWIILRKDLSWKHSKFKEWVSFFLASCSEKRAKRFYRFVCPALRFIPNGKKTINWVSVISF